MCDQPLLKYWFWLYITNKLWSGSFEKLHLIMCYWKRVITKIEIPPMCNQHQLSSKSLYWWGKKISSISGHILQLYEWIMLTAIFHKPKFQQKLFYNLGLCILSLVQNYNTVGSMVCVWRTPIRVTMTL